MAPLGPSPNMPPTFHFVHASDLHLDAPTGDLHRAPSAVIDAACRAPLAAWESLVRLTIEQDAAFLLLAGDICDAAERAVAAQLQLVKGLQQLAGHGIQVFIVRGHADLPGPWAGSHDWPRGVHCFDAEHTDPVAVERGGERIATVHGISAAAPDTVGERVAACRREPAPGLHIGLLHARVEPEPGEDQLLSVQDLQAAGMDYWALGQDHRRRHLTADGAPIVYAGTLQGRGFNESELGPKGADVIQVRDGVVAETTFHALDAIRLVTAAVEVTPRVEDTCRALRAQVLALRDANGGRNLFVRAVLQGQRQAARDWSANPKRRLLDEVRRPETDAHPFVWWDRVLDLTTPAVPAQDEDLATSALRALVDTLRDDPKALDDFLAGAAALPGSAGEFAGEPRLDETERSAVLAEAAQNAMDLLAPNAS
jgi:DNA repair exonuclease SbcCD nuclease subunit